MTAEVLGFSEETIPDYSGAGDEGLGGNACVCEALYDILKQQGLSYNEFLLAVEAAPEDLADFVQMTNTPRS